MMCMVCALMGPHGTLLQTGQLRLPGTVSCIHTVGHSARWMKSTAAGFLYSPGRLAKYSIES